MSVGGRGSGAAVHEAGGLRDGELLLVEVGALVGVEGGDEDEAGAVDVEVQRWLARPGVVGE